MSYIKTAADLQKELNEANENVQKIVNNVTFRFKNLCKKNPDVMLNDIFYKGIPCSAKYILYFSESSYMDVKEMLNAIGQIEKHLADQQAVTQQTLPLES